MHINPYLIFDGRCEEAIKFYETALGAKVEMLMRFGDAPEGAHSPAPKDKIMHASFKVGDTQIMASDGMCTGKTVPHGFSLSLTVPEVAEAKRLFGVLAEGGEIRQPIIETFFAPAFGVVADKIGLSWMILAQPEG